MAFKMFRYLEKHYLGKYRVKAHYDLETLDFPRTPTGGIDEEYDEQYIPCKRGEIRHTYRDIRGKYILAWYCDNIRTGVSVYNELKEKYPEVDWEVDEDLGLGKDDIYCNFGRKKDVIIYFEAKEIDKVASVVGANTRGASIRPYSIKNLPKEPYQIPEQELNEYVEAIEKFKGDSPLDLAQILRKVNKEFALKWDKNNESEISFITQQHNSKLKFKEYVHSIGIWNEYIEFLKQYKG